MARISFGADQATEYDPRWAGWVSSSTTLLETLDIGARYGVRPVANVGLKIPRDLNRATHASDPLAA